MRLFLVDDVDGVDRMIHQEDGRRSLRPVWPGINLARRVSSVREQRGAREGRDERRRRRREARGARRLDEMSKLQTPRCMGGWGSGARRRVASRAATTHPCRTRQKMGRRARGERQADDPEAR